MQTNTFVKIKSFLKKLFGKKKTEEVAPKEEDVQEIDNQQEEEIVANGYTSAPQQYIRRYRTKRFDF